MERSDGGLPSCRDRRTTEDGLSSGGPVRRVAPSSISVFQTLWAFTSLQTRVGGPWEVSSRGERGNNAESRFRSPRCRVLVFALVDAEASQREAPLRKVGSQACRKICSKKAMFVSIWPSKMHLTRRNLEEKQSQRRRRRVLTLRPHQLMMTKQTVTGTRRMTRYL